MNDPNSHKPRDNGSASDASADSVVAGSMPGGNLYASNVPAPLALSTPQRDAAIERLTQSFAEDAITMDEFERRAELVYSAVTVADLKALLVDLPGSQSAAVQRADSEMGVVDRTNTSTIRTIFGNTERRGPVKVPKLMQIRTYFGNTEIDLRHGVFAPGITEIHVKTVFGNVELWVPAGARVEMSCNGVLANVESEVPDPAEGALADVVIRVTGRALLANVEVHRGWKADG